MNHAMAILDALEEMLTHQLEQEQFQQFRTDESLTYHRRGSRSRGDMIAFQISSVGPPMIKGVIRSHQSDQELGLGHFVVENGTAPPLGWAILESTWQRVTAEIGEIIQGQVLPWLDEPHPRNDKPVLRQVPPLKLLRSPTDD
jgi:hypothetical protein